MCRLVALSTIPPATPALAWATWQTANVIDYVCFEKKLATTRELYDAIMNNWEGHEELYRLINSSSVPHYGNGDPVADKYVDFAASTYAEGINRCTGPRGNHFAAGCYPVTCNVLFGYFTSATPGRPQEQRTADGWYFWPSRYG